MNQQEDNSGNIFNSYNINSSERAKSLKITGPRGLFGRNFNARTSPRNLPNDYNDGFITKGVRVGRRQSDNFCSSFQANIQAPWVSPRNGAPVSSTPKLAPIANKEVLSEDSGDFEREEEPAYPQLQSTESGDSTPNLGEGKPTKKCKRISKKSVKKETDKMTKLINMKPAIKRFMRDKQSKERLHAKSPGMDFSSKSIPDNKSFKITAKRNGKKKPLRMQNKSMPKRSQSRVEEKPAKIYEENAFEDLVKKRSGLFSSSGYARSNTTMESYPNRFESKSPREPLPSKALGLQRRATLQAKDAGRLTEHEIHSRKDFEEAVNGVFEKDLANKSLGRKSRVNEGILLDNFPFRKANQSYENGRKNEKTQPATTSSESSPEVFKSTSLKNIGSKTVCKAKIGKGGKQKVIKIERITNKQNIKI